MAEKYRTYDWEDDDWYWPILNWERNAAGALHLVDDFAAYHELYVHRTMDDPKKTKTAKKYGWFTTAKSRKAMVQALEDWGHELKDNPWRVSDRELFEEMRTFIWTERRNRYEHQSGKNDDLVIAIAGCLISSKLLPEPIPIKEAPKSKAINHYHKRPNTMRRETASSKRRRKRRGNTQWDKAKVPRQLRR